MEGGSQGRNIINERDGKPAAWGDEGLMALFKNSPEAGKASDAGPTGSAAKINRGQKESGLHTAAAARKEG